MSAEGAARLRPAYLLHMWVPVLTAPSMALSLAHDTPDATLDPAGLWLLAAGVFIVYTADRLLEHGHGWGHGRPGLWALVAAATAGLAGLVLSQPALWSPVAALGGLSVMYLELKAFPAIKTLVVGVTWAVGCGVLARLPQPGWSALQHPLTASLLLSVASGAILCDLKDADADLRDGVRSLPVVLGARGATAVAAACALMGAAIAVSQGGWAMAACNALMLGLCPFGTIARRPVTGPMWVDGLLAMPGVVVWALGLRGLN